MLSINWVSWLLSSLTISLQTSSVKPGNFEQLSSPNPKPSEGSTSSLNKTGLKRLNPKDEMEPNGAIDSSSGSRVANSQSPFQTPPSMSYCDKVIISSQTVCLDSKVLTFMYFFNI